MTIFILFLFKESDSNASFQAFCPVCRELVSDNVDPIHNALPPLELRNAPAFQLTNELKDLQARMANLFLHQKNLGGIIDLNSEESNVISIDSEENMEAVRVFSQYSGRMLVESSIMIQSFS